MSSSKLPTPDPKQADLLEKIKNAELEANSRLDEAKRQAEKIRVDAKAKADRIVKDAETAAEKVRTEFLQAGRVGMQKELDGIHLEAAQDVKRIAEQKDKRPDLRGLVLSILGM